MTRYDSSNPYYSHLAVIDCPIFDIDLAGPRDIMNVICAWCEREGRQTLIGKVELYDRKMTSHGICRNHKKVVLKQIQQLPNRENPRLQRRRLSLTKLRSSTWLPASRTTRMRTPTRHRLPKDRLSSAQLQLPFGGFEGRCLASFSVSIRADTLSAEPFSHVPLLSRVQSGKK
jgi:hypothetical protein